MIPLLAQTTGLQHRYSIITVIIAVMTAVTGTVMATDIPVTVADEVQPIIIINC